MQAEQSMLIKYELNEIGVSYLIHIMYTENGPG